MSQCKQPLSWLDAKIFAAFPIVCFCDIPVVAATGHRERYGCYALAISKESSSKYDINPVWYLQEGSTIQRHLSDLCKHPVRVTLDTISPALKPLLPFLKDTLGTQSDRVSRGGTNESFPFEEEMEWRHSPAGLLPKWKLGNTRDIVTKADHQTSQGHRLVLDYDDIESIYLPSQKEAAILAQEFPALSKKIQAWPHL